MNAKGEIREGYIAEEQIKCLGCNNILEKGETVFTWQDLEDPSALSWGHESCMESINEEMKE
ncbi:hypothetical protein [endosymbiont GvMRE of Glomus versiforme]|uniref:hypothetical protein n=1 Tax=endosymbiont GvMRE of Glomus versiforme TaxID=2039283 RepID=UPI000ECBEA4B|nr:hypothetical protein [endosymbiont GvMRE of Glomus versiforme]RHZ37748.1 hypothetical protein GvMRE_I1g533 [endosymbiont GvMRE of Glomus versiforme]